MCSARDEITKECVRQASLCPHVRNIKGASSRYDQVVRRKKTPAKEAVTPYNFKHIKASLSIERYHYAKNDNNDKNYRHLYISNLFPKSRARQQIQTSHINPHSQRQNTIRQPFASPVQEHFIPQYWGQTLRRLCASFHKCQDVSPRHHASDPDHLSC